LSHQGKERDRHREDVTSTERVRALERVFVSAKGWWTKIAFSLGCSLPKWRCYLPVQITNLLLDVTVVVTTIHDTNSFTHALPPVSTLSWHLHVRFAIVILCFSGLLSSRLTLPAST